MEEIRRIHFPYCIKKLESGNYVILNRLYKPVGFTARDHVTYENYPIEFTFYHLTTKTVEQLSYCGSSNKDIIYLYNDGCVPTDSDEFMTAYLNRLKILNKLKIKPLNI